MSTYTSPLALLDGDWYFLGVDGQGVRRIALLSGRDGDQAGALCTSRERAQELLDGSGAQLEVLHIGRDDLRAKEEWLADVLAQGATELLIDPGAGDARVEAEKALWYILSFKRQTACL